MKSHYLTIAAFRVEDEDETPNEFTLDDDAPAKGRIKKSCVCGSQIRFGANAEEWICSESGTTLEVLDAYCTPLFTATELQNKSVPSELRDEQIESLVSLDETGELEIFLKVQSKDRWIITDPLPIFAHVGIRPFETDLLVSCSLSVGHGGTRDIGFSILWNVANQLHEKQLRRLASSSTVPLYFLDAVSLSVIGGRQLRLPEWTFATITEAFALYATLPTDEQERRDKLSFEFIDTRTTGCPP